MVDTKGKKVATQFEVNEDIIIDSTPDADHQVSGFTADLTAGENVAFGDVGYMKSDGKVWKSDANAASTMPALFMAIETILADASGKWLLLGYARDASWSWAVGGLIYASATAGALTQTAPSGTGDQVQVVGVATNSTRMFFNPSLVLVEIA